MSLTLSILSASAAAIVMGLSALTFMSMTQNLRLLRALSIAGIVTLCFGLCVFIGTIAAGTESPQLGLLAVFSALIGELAIAFGRRRIESTTEPPND